MYYVIRKVNYFEGSQFCFEPFSQEELLMISYNHRQAPDLNITRRFDCLIKSSLARGEM